MSEVLSRVRTGAWLDAQTFPPLSWAVPGIVPEGFGLFTGPPKVGKSWAVLDIVLAVASGGVAFGSVPIGTARPVLLLALEDGDRRLQARCRKLLAGAPIPDLLHYATTVGGPGEVMDVIDAWLAVYGDARPLVVLDTLGKVSPPSLPGESAYGRDYRIGGHLKARADAHPGTALLVVHHVRKAAGEDWMDSTSGTNGLNGSADFTVSLSRARNDTEGVLKVTGRDVPEGEYAVAVTDGTWTLRGTSLADAARAAQVARAADGLGDRSAEILAFVAEHPEGITSAQVADSLNLPDARRYLARLADAGRLERKSRGLYQTPVPSVPVSQPDTLEWDTGTHGTRVCGTCHLTMTDLGDGATTHPGCGGDA